MQTAPSSPMELNSRVSDRSTPLNTHAPSAFRRPCSADARNLAPSGPMDALLRFRPVTRVLNCQFRAGFSTGMTMSLRRCFRFGALRRTIFGGGVSPSPVRSFSRPLLGRPCVGRLELVDIGRPFIVSHCRRSAFIVSLSPSRFASLTRSAASSARSLALASSTCVGSLAAPPGYSSSVSTFMSMSAPTRCLGGDCFLADMTIGELGLVGAIDATTGAAARGLSFSATSPSDTLRLLATAPGDA
mmetsp:Transcript_1791/g.4598  ORF Transcript_1791/g.4598 Transcript_1791/m.4598 type:complete len:244 (-) Transcript_1791:845-1576(-)